MKQSVAVALFTICFSISSFAQKKGTVEFGLNVGYNSATASTDEYTADYGDGFNLGFSADYYFSDRWSIKGKLIYDQKGWNRGFIENLNTGNRYTTNFNLDYITIPVMANWHFARKRNWYLNFGPYVGFLMSAKETRFDIDVKDGFNTTDFGLGVGVGVKIPVSDKLKISLEYETQSGLTEIFKDSNDPVTNTRWSLNFGVNFLLK